MEEREQAAITVRVLRDTMDYRVVHSVLLAMTNYEAWVKKFSFLGRGL